MAPQVTLVAWTQFAPPPDPQIEADGTVWRTDADGGQALAEFAGRACYQAWDKPNPATATNAGYLRHILEVGHLSVIEHATATFYVTDVSRSLTHELVRHRHFSFSQLSQRYVAAGGAQVVEPDAVAADPELHELFMDAVAQSRAAYQKLLAGLEDRLAGATGGQGATLRRKQARQAARAVLPNATETRIVITGNYRAWRHLIAVRATEHADVEIRALAVAFLRELHRIAPHVFGDFVISTLADGSEIAASPYAAEG